MKRPKPDTAPPQPLTALDPSHPNYDAILLKRSRLEAHRRRRAENLGLVTPPDRKGAPKKPAKKPARREKK